MERCKSKGSDTNRKGERTLNQYYCTVKTHSDKPTEFSAQSEWGYKWMKDTVTYSIIRGTEDMAGDTTERLAVNLAMTTWEAEIPLKLKWVKRDDNPDITIEFRPKSEDDLFLKSPNILAYAYFPNTSRQGEIVFNDAYIWGPKEAVVNVTNPDGSVSRVKQYNVIQTLIHEIGHSLGLTHSDGDTCKECVMHWSYNGQINLAPLDISRIQEKYGKRSWADQRYANFKKWLALRKVRF